MFLKRDWHWGESRDHSKKLSNIALKLCMIFLHIHSEGSMSQTFYLGLSFHFM